ncbi:MAG: serine/threonine-protein kinase [Acidobacteriota bacterium]
MIDLGRWNEIKEIVQAALDLPEEEQAAYIKDTCEGDVELQNQAAVLLSVSATQADAYDNLVVRPPNFYAPEFKDGDEIGPYKILRPLGKGGMGSVYLAEDTRHDRQVALKALTFRSQVPMREQRALAKLNHPNIAALYDSGQTADGSPFFVMEFVDGVPITEYCESHSLSVKKRLRLFLAACEAVAYAHRNLVVHRDIKPGNILVTDDGMPKLLDFGIAKNLSPSLLEGTITAQADRPMTIAFASPEQLSGDVTSTSTDIYSLGVLLCLMLTDRLPYPVKSLHDLPWAVRNMEPERPSQLVRKPAQNEEDIELVPASTVPPSRKLVRSLTGDLDAIVLKALRKEPERRYQTVAELAADIGRHLNDEPVSARKGSNRYRAGKVIQRHPIGVAVGGIVTLVLLGFSILLLGQYRRALRGERQASNQAERTRHVNRFVINLLRRTNPLDQLSDSNASIEELLDQSSRTITTSLNDYPDIKASLLSVLGEILDGRDDDARAKRLLEQALELQRRGPRDLSLAETLQRYGTVLTSLGQYRESDAILAEAKDIVTTTAEQGDPVLESHILLAAAINRIHQADFDSARQLSQEALLSLRHSPNSLPELATSLLALGRILAEKDRDAEAEALFRQALSYAERMHDARNLHVGLIMDSLGGLLYKRGDYTSAQKMYLQALDIERTTMGVGSESYATTLHNLGANASAQGHYDDALEKYMQAVAIYEKKLPPNHQRTLIARNQLATTLVQLGRHDLAEKQLLEILTTERATLSNNHPAVASTLNNLAYLYSDQGRFQEAEICYKEALDIFLGLVGRNSRPVATMHGNLGNIARNKGENRIARRHFEEALEITRGIDGGRIPDTVTALSNLAAFYISTGELTKAHELVTEAVSLAESVVGHANPLTGSIHSLEAKLLLAEGDIPGALSQVRQARAILLGTVPEKDWKVAITTSLLGAALGQSGRIEEAEKLLLGSLSELRRIKGPHSLPALEAQERVRVFYKSIGRGGAAAKYRR